MTGKESSRRLLRFFAPLAAVAFCLNWLWETVQMPAYIGSGRTSWTDLALRHIVPTLGDVTITFGIYGMGALAAGPVSRGLAGRWHALAAASLMGGACASAVEWQALATGRWAYTAAMPIVPVLHVGLWPLLQLLLLTPLAFAAARWWAQRR